ncbi:MAG TPA: hypothetical protein VGG10_15350 [Rhizomicrobium sp.]|jgi:hypothetical protein
MKTVFATLLLGIACAFAGDLHAAPATIPADPKLFLSADGLALSWFPGRHMLTQTVHVDRTQGADPVSWTAVSDRPWLSVGASGMTGGTLAIKANPKGLQRDRFYRATVTVSTSESDFTDTETLTVGLYVGSADPKNIEIAKQYVTHIAANPVEPIVYVTDGGNSIREYNVYSGALITTLPNVAPAIGPLEVSSDGRTLFVANMTAHSIVELATDSGARIGAIPVGYAMDSLFTMAYARPFGQPALYASAVSGHQGSIFAVPSGTKLATGVAKGMIAVPPDGKQIFSVLQSIDPATLHHYSVDLTNGQLNITNLGSRMTDGENCQDLAVSRDGVHVYPACGAPYFFEVFDAKTLSVVQTLPANPYPRNVEIDAKNHVIGGIGSLLKPDILAFKQSGGSLGTVSTGAEDQQPGTLKVSGDTMRVILATRDPPSIPQTQTLMFLTLPSKLPD